MIGQEGNQQSQLLRQIGVCASSLLFSRVYRSVPLVVRLSFEYSSSCPARNDGAAVAARSTIHETFRIRLQNGEEKIYATSYDNHISCCPFEQLCICTKEA